MINHKSVEFLLLPAVQKFCAKTYPNCLVIFHPSVFFADPTFRTLPLDEAEAKTELGTSPKTKNIAEVTPDYGIFRKTDILGIKMRIGQTNGEELFVEPYSPQFSKLTSAAAPIPYMAWQSQIQSVPKGKKMVVVLKDNTFPRAIVDHKGKSDVNSQKQRRKVAYQARRFGAPEIFMLTDTNATRLVKKSGPLSVAPVFECGLGTIWKMSDTR